MREGNREEVLSYFDGICAKAAAADRPAEGLEALGHCRPRADRQVDLRPRHAARRRGASDAAVPGAGRLHGDGGCGDARRGAARARRTTSPAPSRCISARASPAPRGSCCRRARWAASSTPRASSGWCATSCGRTARPSASTTPWSGSTAGRPTTAWLPDDIAIATHERACHARTRPPRRPARRLRAALTRHNLVPLWPNLRAVLPPTRPKPRTRATHWSYESLRPLLLRAGELTPIEKAERRVLVLANPGHGLDKMQASAAMYLGMQLLLPGEWAPSHRHTPNAVRMVVEGEGAWSTVDGEKCPMRRGDLILTPTGLWHEHGHDGDEPVVWLDVLDLPLVYYMEASYHVDGPCQAVDAGPRRPRLRPRRAGADARLPARRQGLSDAALSVGRRACRARVAGRRPADARRGAGRLRQSRDRRRRAEHPRLLRADAAPGPDARPAGALAGGGVPPHRRQSPRCASRSRRFALAEADTCCAPGYSVGEPDQPRSRRAGLLLHRRRDAAAQKARRVREAAAEPTAIPPIPPVRHQQGACP